MPRILRSCSVVVAQQRPRLRRLAAAAGLVSLLFANAGAQAQNNQQLYDAARNYDATFLAARAQADSAQYQLERIKASQRPTLGLTASSTRSGSETPATGPSQLTQSSASLSARQPLFNRGNALTIAQAERSLQVAGADLDNAEQDLIVRLTQAYFEVLATQDTLATAQTNKTAIAEQLASARRNFEVGTATITDAREAQARFDLATAQEITADNNLRTARVALDQLVGMPDVSPRPFAVPVVLPTLAPANVEAWLAQAATAPNIRRAPLAFDIAQLETGKARAGHLPTVDLVRSHAQPPQPQRVRATAARAPEEAAPSPTPAWACSSTCRSSPATRCRTGSRRRSRSRKKPATIWKRRAAP